MPTGTGLSRYALRAAFAFTAALAGTIAAPARAQQAAPAPRVDLDRAQLERRIASVEVLLHGSSAARQVEASGDAHAIANRDLARGLYRQAVQAFKAGDGARASALLAQASARMFEAVRRADPEQVNAAKMRVDFDARLESVRALHQAQKRILGEKPGAPGSAEAADAVARLLREAESLAQAKDLPAARATLDRAYLIAKAAVSSLRSGDTLVRSLNFASKKEEYDYEVDRNDTHRMLIQVLVTEKRQGSQGGRGMEGFLEQAAGLREQAEAAAAAGDHPGAVRLLEDSTRALIRAIRGAGIYIPG